MAQLHQLDAAPGRKSVDELAHRCEERIAICTAPAQLQRAAAAHVMRVTDRSRIPTIGPSHGDVSTTNVLWDASTQRFGVIDFEHGAARPAAHDLSVLIANVLVDTFHPLSSVRRSAEILEAVVEGHGDGVEQQADTTLAWACAVAWLCGDFVPRMQGRPGGPALVRARSRAVARVMAMNG